MVRQPRDKSTVEVDKTNKGLHFLLVSWGGPVCYTSNLDRIYFDLIVQDDHTQVLGPSLLELALIRLKKEFMLAHLVENQ
jgi:hypothetical protein